MLDQIQEYSKKAYENAKKNGYYTNNPSIDLCCMWIIEEIIEAKKSYKQNNFADFKEFERYCNVYKENVAFEKVLKDCYEVELADIFITILSFSGFKDIDFSDCKDYCSYIGYDCNIDEYFIRVIDKVVGLKENQTSKYIWIILFELFYWCDFNAINIKKFIDLKMEYNSGL